MARFPFNQLILAATLVFCAPLWAEIPAEQLAFFEKRVRPILADNCYRCHSADAEKIKGGLLLDTRDSALKGGDTGPVIAPGEPDASLLVEAIHWANADLQMPPEKKLSGREIADLEKWIRMGAPDPRDGASKAISIQSEIDYEEGRKHWAYQPISRSEPAVKEAKWPRGGIDLHILASLESNQLRPVEDAGPIHLVRRLYFDLIGLPPSPGQVDAFLSEVESAGRDPAIVALVDSLLDSSHFGERWGRHWLDVVRYAESNGMERNFLYPHAWRYRDYVIDSFNRDKPFDQFIREQVAGDLLEDATDETRVATGFLAIGPKILNERDKKIFAYEMADEQIDATTRAFMGLTVSCARCHDHKFDAISQRDYYALAGIFTSSETLYGTAAGGGNRQGSTLAPIGENVDSKLAALREHQQKVAAVSKKRKSAEGKLKKAQKLAKAAKSQPAKLNQAREEIARMNRIIASSKKEIAALQENRPDPPDYAMGLRDRGKPADSPLLIRGNVATQGDIIPRGVLTVLHEVAEPPEFPGDACGRLELAAWISDPSNPLTARVMANRIWSHLFGQGIVATVDNFGVSGEKPANPELLDHLAGRFVDLDWSVKGLIREIVLSRTYQLGSGHDAGNYELDPDNRLTWRRSLRRLDAESIRDAVLAASGDLVLSPADGSVVAKMGNGNYGRDAKATALLQKEFRENYRSAYLPIVRNAAPPALTVFDFAEPSLIVGRRNETTVPAQALFMMNSRFILDQSEKLARRVLTTDAISDSDRLAMAYRWTLSRPPRESETEPALAFLAKATASSPDENDAAEFAWTALCQALFSSAEFRYLN